MGAIKNIFQNIRSRKGNNWKAIVLSIVAASVFWLFQSLNKNYSTNINYPIAFHFPQDQYVVVDELPSEIQINVSGIGWNIFRKTFSFRLNPVSIDLEDPADTRKIVGAALLANINDQLPQFQVNYIISDTLYLNIEPKISRTFAISYDSLSIDLKNNFKITSQIIMIPDSITISGPQSIIAQLSPVLPLNIPNKQIDTPFDEAIPFKVREYQQSLLNITPENVQVGFDVEEYVTISYKTTLVAKDTVDPKNNIYAVDSTVNVTYSIPRAAQASIEKSKIVVEGLLETLNKQDSTIKLVIKSYPSEISAIVLDSTSTFLKVIYE